MRRDIEALRADGPVEALAVCFLYSFVAPTHERLVRSEIRARCPGLSSRCPPTSRRSSASTSGCRPRSSTPTSARSSAATCSASATRSGRLGIRAPPYINQSNGGIISVAAAAEQPVRTLLSGPSAGVMGAAWVARPAGIDSIITFDMGGTSTDVARVRGRPAGDRAQRTIGG